jgi:hypothetical protein
MGKVIPARRVAPYIYEKFVDARPDFVHLLFFEDNRAMSPWALPQPCAGNNAIPFVAHPSSFGISEDRDWTIHAT